jgi:DnaJ-class molecular chaperone
MTTASDPSVPGSDGDQVGSASCPDCAGTGRRDEAPCERCGGTGAVEELVGDA